MNTNTSVFYIQFNKNFIKSFQSIVYFFHSISTVVLAFDRVQTRIFSYRYSTIATATIEVKTPVRSILQSGQKRERERGERARIEETFPRNAAGASLRSYVQYERNTGVTRKRVTGLAVKTCNLYRDVPRRFYLIVTDAIAR